MSKLKEMSEYQIQQYFYNKTEENLLVRVLGTVKLNMPYISKAFKNIEFEYDASHNLVDSRMTSQMDFLNQSACLFDDVDYSQILKEIAGRFEPLLTEITFSKFEKYLDDVLVVIDIYQSFKNTDTCNYSLKEFITSNDLSEACISY